MKPRALLDMDGVIADFMKAALETHSIASNTYDLPENKGNWDIVEVCGITKPADFWSAMGYEFWRNIPLMPDAHQIVQFLTEQYGVDNLCVLTSPVRTAGCVEGKRDWLVEHFPQFKRRFLIGPRKEFCASPTAVLYDDYIVNCRAFEEQGGHACLVPRAWSRNHEVPDAYSYIRGYTRAVWPQLNKS